jgi:hypothetical protein
MHNEKGVQPSRESMKPALASFTPLNWGRSEDIEITVPMQSGTPVEVLKRGNINVGTVNKSGKLKI